MPESNIYRCFCKATDGEPGRPRYSASWVRARRNWFTVFGDRVECGDWRIPYADVKAAVLFETRQWFIPVRVLSIETGDATYQFGFNPWAHPERYISLELQRKRVRMCYSTYSVIARVIVFGTVAAFAWLEFSQ